ncbi:MAG: hypothetical protein MRY78_09370 [Saprospiraceae bacterium]|nr:hypothetical protein [Saprospiraceae bacterium]
MEDRILTLHPSGKKGVNILRSKYDQIATLMLEIIKNAGTISYEKLNEEMEQQLAGKFEGSIPWYVVTVKLDLEARGTIERVPKNSPHELRLTTSKA